MKQLEEQLGRREYLHSKLHCITIFKQKSTKIVVLQL